MFGISSWPSLKDHNLIPKLQFPLASNRMTSILTWPKGEEPRELRGPQCVDVLSEAALASAGDEQGRPLAQHGGE